jgi:hypothetical protein
MRRYRVRAQPGSLVSSVVVGWDADEGHYVCELSYEDGGSDQRRFGYLRDLIHRMHSVVVLDDLLLRALLKDRRAGSGGGR